MGRKLIFFSLILNSFPNGCGGASGGFIGGTTLKIRAEGRDGIGIGDNEYAAGVRMKKNCFGIFLLKCRR